MEDAVQRAAESNISFGLAIVSILFFLFGVIVGVHVGEELGGRCVSRRRYALANLGWLLGGVLLSTLVFCTGWVAFAAITIGMIAGGLAGLKFGFGESVGPWKFVDTHLKANDAHVAAASDPEAAERRRAERSRRRRAGEPEPELMSVAPREGGPTRNGAGDTRATATTGAGTHAGTKKGTTRL